MTTCGICGRDKGPPNRHECLLVVDDCYTPKSPEEERAHAEAVHSWARTVKPGALKDE